MLAEVVVAPAVPPVAITAAILLLLVMWVALLGLMKGYDYSLGALLRRMADLVGKVPFVGGKLADAFDATDHFILARMADGLKSIEHQVARLWAALEWLVMELGNTLVAFAGDIKHAVEGIIHGDIPAQVGARVGSVARDVNALRRSLQAEAARLTHRMEALAGTLERDLENAIGRAWRGIDHIRSRDLPRLAAEGAALTAAIAGLRRFARGTLTRRLSALERRLAAGTIGAVALSTLTRVFPWWKCTNVRKLMRGTCRANPAWLEFLFGAGVEVFVVSQLCDFIEGLSLAAEAVAPELLAFVDVEDVLIDCHGATKPPPLSIGPLDVPRGTDMLSLAA